LGTPLMAVVRDSAERHLAQSASGDIGSIQRSRILTSKPDTSSRRTGLENECLETRVGTHGRASWGEGHLTKMAMMGVPAMRQSHECRGRLRIHPDLHARDPWSMRSGRIFAPSARLHAIMSLETSKTQGTQGNWPSIADFFVGIVIGNEHAPGGGQKYAVGGNERQDSQCGSLLRMRDTSSPR